MSEDRTAETNGSRSFEERVFARFDAIDFRFNAIDTRFNAIDTRFDAIDTRIDRMESRFERRFISVEQHLTSVDDRLEKLEAKQYDTKPIWERVLAELGTLKEQMTNLDRKFDVLTKDMMQLRADQKFVHERLDRLESH